MALVSDASTYNWTTKNPVSMLDLKYDSLVPNSNTLSVCYPDSPSLYSNSAPGLVNCTAQIDNTQLWAEAIIAPGLSGMVYMNHNGMEALLQLAAWNQMQTNPH